MKNTVSFFILSLLVSMSGIAVAQSNCFFKNYNKGQEHLSKFKYKEAKPYFDEALNCTDANKEQKKLAHEMIDKCNKNKDKKATSTPVNKKPQESSKPVKKEPDSESIPIPIQVPVEQNESLGVWAIGEDPDTCVEECCKYTVWQRDSIYFWKNYEGGTIDLCIDDDCRELRSNITYYPDLPDWIEKSSYYGFKVEPAETREERSWTGYATCPGCKNIIKITIRQEGVPYVPKAKFYLVGNPDPQKSVSVDVFTEFRLENLAGKEVRDYVMFYQEDGVTPLLNQKGEWVRKYESFTPSNDDRYERSEIQFDKFEICKNATGNKVKFVAGISADGGKTWMTRSKIYELNVERYR